jgi:hypothetical protein
MPIFCFHSRSKDIHKFVRDTNARLSSDNVVSNPFRGEIKRVGKDLFVVSMSPIYADFSWMGFLFGIPMIIFLGFSLWLIIPSIILLSHILFMKEFYYLMLKWGAKKVSCSISYVPVDKALREVCFGSE